MTLTLPESPRALSIFTPMALLLWAWSAGVAAQTVPPTAGQVLRALQPAAGLPTPQAAPLPPLDNPPPAPGPNDATV